MALFAEGPLIGIIRGKVGGAVFTNSKAGSVIRAWTKPKDSATPGQRDSRAKFSVIAGIWNNTLTPLQRTGWDTLAATATLRNSLGQQFTPSGREFFIRAAIWQLSVGSQVTLIAPIVPFAAWPNTSIDEAAGPIIQLAAVGDVSAFKPVLIRSQISPPLPVTVNRWYGPWPHQEVSFWANSAAPITVASAPSLPRNARYFLRIVPATLFNAVGAAQQYTFDLTLA